MLSTTFRLIQPDAGRGAWLYHLAKQQPNLSETIDRYHGLTALEFHLRGPLGRFNVYVLLCVGVSWPLPELTVTVTSLGVSSTRVMCMSIVCVADYTVRAIRTLQKTFSF